MGRSTFHVEYHRDGIKRLAFEVPANACRGLSEVPDFEAVCRHLPAKLWPALQRGGWWEDKHSPNLPLRCDLQDKRGAPMGSLFATRTGRGTPVNCTG